MNFLHRCENWNAGREGTRPTLGRRKGADGSVLIIVLWVAFGLVALALHFAHAMSLELRASDNRCAGLEAEQAIAGAIRYVSNVLARLEIPGTIPSVLSYRSQAVPVGDATFWLIGRSDQPASTDQPTYALVDECSKLNLNTATSDMLLLLPRMTPGLAAAIVDWRDSDDTLSSGGAEIETYGRLTPAYRCKNTNFESVAELRLVSGADLDILLGEDNNLNGVLDPNENDGDTLPPTDNRDGQLDPGIFEYLTVSSREPNTTTNGTARLNVAGPTPPTALQALLQTAGVASPDQVMTRLQGQPVTSLLDFYIYSGMTLPEFELIEPNITFTNGQYIVGLVNVNTASAAVLACIPGIGTDKAPSVVAYRQSNPNNLTSVGWLVEALDRASAIVAGPYVTAHSYQFSADIAAVGHQARGYRRVKVIFDTSDGTPRVVYRQDLTQLGWSLGSQGRQEWRLARGIR